MRWLATFCYVVLWHFPVPYVIAFTAGRSKNLDPGWVILPVLRDVPDLNHRV